MNSIKYVGLDVHQSNIRAAVLDRDGKLAMQCVLPTQARAIIDFFDGMRGTRAMIESSEGNETISSPWRKPWVRGSTIYLSPGRGSDC